MVLMFIQLLCTFILLWNLSNNISLTLHHDYININKLHDHENLINLFIKIKNKSDDHDDHKN